MDLNLDNIDINLDNIALELYEKLQTRFPEVEFGNEYGEKLSKEEDIPQARFFEFPYKINGNTLGTVTITLHKKKGIILQIGGNLANAKHANVFKFIRSIGLFAKSRLLNFKIINLEKNGLDKRDYEFQAKRKEEAPMEPVMESKMYGTSKISYQDLGEARLVIKHNQAVNTEIPTGRSMNIESIYIENAQGERFKYPYKHVNGARALAEHIKHGGNPYDAIGKHITGLSEELSQLRKFKGYVGRNTTLGEAMGDITSKVMERIEQIKKEVHGLQRKSYYETFAESFTDSEEQLIPEEIMSDWIDRLTIRTFNEELKTAFPYIFRLVSETDIPVKEISADDLLDEAYTPSPAKPFRNPPGFNKQGTGVGNKLAQLNRKEWEEKKKEKKLKEEDQFESFMDALVNEDEDAQNGRNTLFNQSPEIHGPALAKFKDKIANVLPAGAAGQSAIQDLTGIIDTQGLQKRLKELDPGSDSRSAIQLYLKDLANDDVTEPFAPHANDIAKALVNDPELKFDGGNGQEPPAPEIAPAAPAPDATASVQPQPPTDASQPPAQPQPTGAEAVPGEQQPPAPQPVAENASLTKLKAKLIRAKEYGATLETVIDFGHRAMTLQDAILESGMSLADVGFGGQGDALESMKEFAKGFLNREKENFTRGPTGVITKVAKEHPDHFDSGEPKTQEAHDFVEWVNSIDPLHDELGQIKHLSNAQPHATAVVIKKVEPITHNSSLDIMKQLLGKMR